ncbi:MAG: RluA family pseudouridine synthase [Methylovirgula sp.]|jgi:23S rRNA pseudouridine955/2504/2580 synthase
MPVDTLTVTEDEAGMRLDRWFKRRLPTLSLAHLNKIVRTGQVRVDGARATTATRLAAGQKIRVPPVKIAPPPPKPAVSDEDRRVLRAMILYEDDDLLVLNKPYGLAVQGGSGTTRHIDGMLASLADARGERPVLVHRLDRDTAGVLLVAKSRRIAAKLGEIFRSRQAQKIYWALVEGVPKPAQGRISLFLAKGAGMEQGARRPGTQPGSLEKMRIAQHGDENARHSVTYYAVVDKVPGRLAWLSMKPITGRTHQLRAHAEAIGHPIVGDPKYAGKEEGRQAPQIPAGMERKLHLLARRIVLPHPRGGTLDVTAPLPPHMKKSFEMFGFDAKRADPIEQAPE